MFERTLFLWLSLLSAVAFYWTEWFPAAPDVFAATRPWLGPLFAATMFIIGSLLPHEELRAVGKRWPAVLGGTAVQYAAMPALAYLAAHLFDLPGELRVGVVLVGCVPGAMASNVVTLAARGNVSYSVSLTTLATLLSPVVVPLALWLTLGRAEMPDPLDTSRKLLLEVVLPVAAGHLLARRFPSLQTVMQRIGPPVANAVILWIIAVVVGLNRARLHEAPAIALAALLTVNLAGYTAGYVAGRLMRLPGAMTRALTLEVGMQNAGLGSLLALELFPSLPGAAIPTAAYTFGCMLTGTLLAQLWSRKRQEPA